MATVSRDNTEHTEDHGPVLDRYTEANGYTISFTEFRETIDGTPMLARLPGGHCQCPHWGYVLKGRLTFRFADREEVSEAGDAYYAPPGHVPIIEAGTEILMFSPTHELKATDDAIKAFMQEHQPA